MRRLAYLLVRHGEAIEADLLTYGVDLLDLYRGLLSARRVWVLIEHVCTRRGTALAFSLLGERGRWTTSDEILAAAHGVKPPEDKSTTDWKRAQQDRIKKLRAARAKTSAVRPG